jgi:phosphocarrier protein
MEFESHKKQVVSKIFTITNKLGLHARAASQFVQMANSFKSDIYVEKDGQEINGKSIMGILMLAATKGSKIAIRAEGDDASEVIVAIEELVTSKFGEEE